MLVGIDHRDDSAVYKLSEDIAMVQSLDFFTPIVDDPFTFGQITAANALSDIYAMGAKPVTALNIVGFPVEELDNEILKQILRGGLDKINESGAVLAGGHSIKDDELKYGLSVTGVVHPKKLISNKGALPGDSLILTKSLGTGIIATGLKRKKAAAESVEAMTQSMIHLNKYAADIATQYEINAMTDVTGYGLIGHLLEMLDASSVNADILTAELPLLPGVLDLVQQNIIPGGLKNNHKFYKPRLEVTPDVDSATELIAVDPQTSGGLLISIRSSEAKNLLNQLHNAGIDEAQIIGEITSSSSEPIITLR